MRTGKSACSMKEELMRSVGARADAEDVGNGPGDGVAVVLREGSLEAAKHFEFCGSGMHIKLRFRSAFEMLGGDKADPSAQQRAIEIVHREWRARKNKQNASCVVLAQGRLAPLSLLLG